MSTNQNRGLEIQLKLIKESYFIGEPIDIILILKNQSNAPLTINKRMGINPPPERMVEGTWEVKFDIAFPPGERLVTSTLINRGEPDREDFIVIPPGGEIQKTYTLTDFYWMELPGTYEIKAIYHNTNDGEMFELSAWTGNITSNPVRLRVIDSQEFLDETPPE
jgi:hypothetical protein